MFKYDRNVMEIYPRLKRSFIKIIYENPDIYTLSLPMIYININIVLFTSGFQRLWLKNRTDSCS